MASSRVSRQLRVSLSALLAMVWFVDHALAQSILHVCPPIRISEITSGLSTTSGVSSDQLDAIDKHHTAYLLRYHSEIESEVRGLAEKTGAQPMGAADMEKTLRAFDQVLTRISECDNQLFDAVVSVLDGDSVSQFARVRAMRECRRQLDGYTLRAVRSFGEGVDFVDCIRSVSRQLRESLSTEEDRVQFAAWVDRNQSLLVQHARSLHDAARPAIVAVSVESESRMDQFAYGDDTDESSLTPEEQQARWAESQRRYAERMNSRRSVGSAIRTILREQITSSRTALRELRGLIDDARLDRLRMDFGVQCLGGQGHRPTELDALVRKLRADGQIEQGGLSEVEARWHRDRADALERLIDAALAETWDASNVDVPRFHRQRLSDLAEEVSAIDRAASEALRVLVGARATEYFELATYWDWSSDAPQPGERWQVKRPSVRREVESPRDAHERLPGEFHPISASEVERAIRLSGMDELVEVASDVYASWRSAFWDAKHGALMEEETALVELSQAQSKGIDSPRRTKAQAKALADRKRAVSIARIDLLLAAETELFGMLQATLGVEADDAVMLLIRSSAVARLGEEGISWGFGEALHSARIASPPEVLSALGVPPGRVRELLSYPGWRECVDRLPDLARESFLISFGSPWSSGEDERLDDYLIRAEAFANKVHSARVQLGRVLLASIDSVAGDEAERWDYRRTVLSCQYPMLMKQEGILESWFRAALVWDGLDEATRNRVEELRSEYRKSLGGLLDEFISLRDGPDLTYADYWSDSPEWTRRNNAFLGIDFLKQEFTWKAGLRLKRIVGPGFFAPSHAGGVGTEEPSADDGNSHAG